MVQRGHLLNGDGIMTNISMRNGLVVFSAGKVGTDINCCQVNPLCQQCVCQQCETGWLPDSLTVTFSGYPADDLVPGPPLVLVNFESCMVDFAPSFVAASANVTEPGGTPGAISEVTMVGNGSGYATLGRVEPTLTISGGSGSGATLTPVLGVVMDEFCNLIPHWEIDSVTVTDGGADFVNGEQLTVTVASGDTEEVAAELIALTTISAPTITATVSGTGSGASISVTVTENPYAPGSWYVSALTIVSAGSGYTDYDAIEFTADTGNGDVVVSEANGYVLVDGGGAITTSEISLVGSYFNDNGVIASVTVNNAGEYYREDSSEPAIVPPVTGVISQYLPSAGAGAVIHAVVDDDPASATFGQIIDTTISNAGSGYLAYELVPEECIADRINGKSFVVYRNSALYGNPGSIYGTVGCCAYGTTQCVDGAAGPVVVGYYGPNSPVHVNWQGITLYSTTNITNCAEMSFTAEVDESNWPGFAGFSATVVPGGEIVRECIMCHMCCRNEAEPPCNIEVDIYPDEEEPVSVVLSAIFGNEWRILLPGGALIRLYIQECNYQPAEAENCLHCWKKCETVAVVEYPNSCTLHFTESGVPCKRCADTVDTPMCQPQSGTYVLDQIYNPSGFCSDGHSKWTIVVP